ncbi:1,4-beta-N-acetylmuramidase [Oenococcus sicerae]|uniref:1,4-beta-N-acetylmuramidase n=6 Tax=Oenococcus sicerae TaxID=2203724 RepID=A0ABX5QP52_9LACO|nr:1,4-beta-N-acetylmuramidase [Oenococcus sicerae]
MNSSFFYQKNYLAQAQTTSFPATITSTNIINRSAKIYDSARNDWVLNAGPAFTSATTLGPNAWGRNYNGHSVTVLKEAVTLRAGQTYKYVQVKDLTANKTYWIDERAVLGTITSTKSVSYQAIINDASRNDWLLNDGPALTSWSTLASNGSGAAYDGHIVTVIQQATTTRGDGQTYTYYQVKDTTANKTYWIDARGVSYDQIIKTTQSDQYGKISGDRNDWVLYNGPVHTSASTMTASDYGNHYVGDTISVLQIVTTKRVSDGKNYQYAQVQDVTANKTYWIDLRSLSLSNYATITSTNIINRSAKIYDSARNDWVLNAGPAFTSATTLGPNAWGRNYNGHSVTVLKEAVTLRAGQTYKYVQVKDLTANKTYWIDERAVLGTITSTKSVSYQAIINDASRNDWLLNDGPALTSWSTLASNGSGAAYDGHIVTVIQQATTTRGDGQTYTYYQVKDTTANKTYWIDARGVSIFLNGYDISNYQSGISNGTVAGNFVIVKATEGTAYINPAMANQVASTLKAGKRLGLYHFASVGNAVDQANYFVKQIKSYLNGQSLLVLDWEGDAMNQGVAWAKTWLDTVYKLTGVRPLIYMSKSVTTKYNWSSVASNYGLWVAQYANDDPTGYQSSPWTDSNSYGAWSHPTIFQYTDNGSLTGYNGPLDLDIFYGDANYWNTLARIA